MNYTITLVLLAGGALGGVAAAVRTPGRYPLQLPFTEKQLQLGFLADLFLGALAAVVARTLVMIFPEGGGARAGEVGLEEKYLIQLLGFGVAAGFAGIKILEKAATSLLQSKQENLEHQLRVKELVDNGRDFHQRKHYAKAVQCFREALQLDPENEIAKTALAVSQSFLGESYWIESIQLLSQVIDKNPKADRALYNRACIKALVLNKGGSYTKDEIIEDLEWAIKNEPSYKQLARADADLKIVSDHPRFNELVS